MKPLIILIVVFLLAIIWTLVFHSTPGYFMAGRIAMTVMLIFTAVGHIKYADGMSMMIPKNIPLKKPLVYFTGILEIVAGVGLVRPAFTRMSAWILIAFFILILPANIYAAIKHVDYEKGTYQGPGPNYLWFRIPLQLFFIAWVYYFGILHAPR